MKAYMKISNKIIEPFGDHLNKLKSSVYWDLGIKPIYFNKHEKINEFILSLNKNDD